MKRLSSVVCVLVAFLSIVSMVRSADEPEETKEQRDARLKWWREARFGMFIHWGVYSVPAGTYDDKKIGGIGEWIMHNGRIPVDVYAKYT
jgi:alpha-L-fucosidase